MDNNIYESDELLNQYLLFHYGEQNEQMPWDFGPREALDFPVRLIQEGCDLSRLPSRGRALDVGCAVGRATFELARHFEEAIGIDFSHAFIDAARTLLNTGQLTFHIRETGLITASAVARAPVVPAGRLVFEQGDAQHLRNDLGQFDFVIAANLLCRLPRPVVFLDRLSGLVRPAGHLVLTTPNTWLEEFTAREYWLGATPQTGSPLEALRNHLEATFVLDKVWDMPFLIREHHRKYQWSVAQASRWIRKD